MMQAPNVHMAKIGGALAGAVTIGLLAAGCGQQQAVSVSGPNQTSPQHVSYSVTIVNGGQKSHPTWPYFDPGNITLPANSIVSVTIKNEDDGADAVPAQYAKVTGTVGGTETVNGKTVSAVAVNDVSHTLTVAALGINIPMPPSSTITFTVRTKGPGSYTWQCMVPCGSGSAGWSGAMATNTWMVGTFVVQ